MSHLTLFHQLETRDLDGLKALLRTRRTGAGASFSGQSLDRRTRQAYDATAILIAEVPA